MGFFRKIRAKIRTNCEHTLKIMKILRTARLGSNFTDSYKTGRQKDTKELLWRQKDTKRMMKRNRRLPDSSKHLTLKRYYSNPANIFLFKDNHWNTRTSEICSMLTTKTPKRRQWHLSGVSFTFVHTLNLSPKFFLLSLNRCFLTKRVLFG